MAVAPLVEPSALRCPRCGAALGERHGALQCSGADCGQAYPVVDSRPHLIDPSTSLFAANGSNRDAEPGGMGMGRFLPSLSTESTSRANFDRFRTGLLAIAVRPRVLVVGGGRLGRGMAAVRADRRLAWTETDVRADSRAALLCDAGRIPFADSSFEGVVVQAVLEHVLEPEQVAAEIARVLVPDGWVYAETPFLQHVHAGAHDFTRFTHLGHRWLFRRFDEVGSGAVGGPGAALAWAWQGFLVSWGRSIFARKILTALARCSAFWLKYCDLWAPDRPAALDAASAYYFLGRKTEAALDFRRLPALYRGAQI